MRAPVNVQDGNFKLAEGACAWWDGIKRAG
jgi:hypothetical protein